MKNSELYKSIKKAALVAVVFLVFSFQGMAQCAMCRATAESSIEGDGYGIATGLNNGIIFLMGIPYILLAILFAVFYRKQIGGFLKSFSDIH